MSLRVLIVENEKQVRAVLRDRLEDAGLTVVDEAADGHTAVAYTELHDPDLVVLDHHMPGELGVDVVPRLRNSSSRAKLILYTANDSPGVHREAAAAGIAAVVDKAGGPEALVNAIRRVCGPTAGDVPD